MLGASHFLGLPGGSLNFAKQKDNGINLGQSVEDKGLGPGLPKHGTRTIRSGGGGRWVVARMDSFQAQ